jgi:hypothetical protein
MTNEMWANPPTEASLARQRKGRKLAPVAALLVLANVILFASCSSAADGPCFNCDDARGSTSAGV